jgi:hypothetical protein
MIDINLNGNSTDAIAQAAGKQGFFLGGLGRSEITADPYIGGYGFLVITHIPTVLKDIITDDIKNLLEVSLKELSGINDQDLSTNSIQGGFTTNEHHYPTEINKNIYEITCKWQERTGNVFRRIFQKWVTSIRDPETGLYTFPAYGKKHYSIEAMYINTNPSIGSSDPEARKQAVEFACYFTGMFPKKNPLSHFNFSSGSHDIADNFDINFAVNTIQGTLIDRIASDMVARDDANSIYWRLNNIPGSTDVSNVNPESLATSNLYNLTNP